MANIIKRLAFKYGWYNVKMTRYDRIKSLIDRLKPVQTDFELIRIGSQNDGGYLVPDDLDDISMCFSPGVDVNASFEIDLFKKFNINSHLADFSVDGPPQNFTPLSFTKKFIGAFNNDKYMTLEKWVNSKIDLLSSKDLMLQMDIEGSEYSSLLSISDELLKRFRIIVVEFHSTRNWGDPKFFEIVESVFEKLMQNFIVAHNHPNNCCGLIELQNIPIPKAFEITFLRKDRTKVYGGRRDFPHALDRPNLIDKPDLQLPKVWFE